MKTTPISLPGDRTSFYVTAEKAFVTVPVRGPNDCGVVMSYCLRSRITTPEEEVSTKETKGAVPAGETLEEEEDDGWRVMRVEMRVKKHKDKRLIVFKEPEADEAFVNTFHDYLNDLDEE